MEKAQELLKALGVSKEVISRLEDEDFDAKAEAKAIQKATQEQLKEALKNDPELNDSIATKTTGQLFGTLRSELKRAGLSTEEVAEDKTIKDMVKALTTKLNEGKSDDLQALQNQLMEAKGEIKRLQDEEIPTIRTEAQKKADSVIANMKLKEAFLAFPADDLVSKKHNEGIFNALNTGLQAKYDIRIDEDGNPALYQKGKELKATTEGGAKVLELSTAIKNQLEEYDFVIKSNGNGTTTSASREADPARVEAPQGPAKAALERAKQLNEEIEKYSKR